MMEEREYGIATFDESDVISRFQPTAKAGFYKWDDDAQWHSEFSNPRICEQYLAMIQTLYDRGIKTEDLNEVSGNVFLPDVDGDLHAFPDLYSSSFISHGFPTEELPPIIDRKLAPHPILKKKHWRLPNVTLSKFLDEHELNESSDTYRRRIWLWVNKESNNISTLDLRRLAGVKIWPDTRGNLFSLAELCHPRQKILRDAVAKHINIPSRAVLRLPKIKSAKRGILFIRSYSSEEEFEKFLSDGMESFQKEQPLPSDEIERFIKFEELLIKLNSEPHIGSYMSDLDYYCQTLNQEYVLIESNEVVCETLAVKYLNLLPQHLALRQSFSKFQVVAWRPPSTVKVLHVLEAIEAEPGNTVAMIPRIKAYLDACQKEGIEETTDHIRNIEFIPHGESFLAPSDCSFISHRGDFWGEWKVSLDARDYSPEESKLLTKVGVFPGKPEKWMTVEFFEWLNEQDSDTLSRHLVCVIRHINENLEPDTWKVSHAHLRCLPILNGNRQVELTSISAITSKHSSVYLDDHSSLGDNIRESFGKHSVSLALETHEDIKKPITDKLKQLGIKSLKAKARSPDKVEGNGRVRPAENLQDILEKLCSARMEREFEKRLVTFDIDSSLYPIWNNWSHKLRQIDQVMLAEQVMESVKLGKFWFKYETGAGLDTETQVLFVRDPPETNSSEFYQVLTNLIFKRPQRFLASNIPGVIMSEFQENPATLGIEKPRKTVLGSSPEDDDDPDEDGPTPQSVAPHDYTPHDPAANIPKPGDLTPSAGTKPRNKGTAGKVHEKVFSDQQSRGQSAVEKEAIYKLKNEHYAFHCQICLASNEVSTLAPAKSYAEHILNRRKIFEAHHTEHHHTGGAGHAGNLLILCHSHHHEFGDLLSRAMITKALRKEKNWMEIKFPAGGKSKIIKGTLIDLYLPTKDKHVDLFFTQQHAEIWLKLAD